MARHEEEARDWSRRLSDALERPVTVQFGRARRNVVVARRVGEHTQLRLNYGFLEAPPEVFEALVAWLRSGKRARRACALLDEWVEELGRRLGPPTKRAVAIEPEGSTHDLRPLALEVLRSDFADELPESLADRVTWGRRGNRKSQRTLQLGSYDPERDLVRIHPVLDQPAVPRFFVRYVLFHELLHALIDRTVPSADPRKKRRAHHPPEFREREASYAEFDRALGWQEQHLGALFRSVRSGKPMRVRPRGEETVRRAWAAAQGWLFPDALSDEPR